MAWLRLIRVILVGLIVIPDGFHGLPVYESQEDNLQEIVFFANQDYTGASEEWTRNEPHLQDNSLIGRKAKSFCVRKGVWVVSFNFTITDPPTSSSCISDNEGIIMESVLVNSNIGMVCFSLHDEDKGQAAIYTAIKHLASNNLDVASLSLFEPGWTGTELYLTGNSIKLPTSVAFSSFAFTGLESWTLFSGVDHTGLSACLPSGWGASNPGLTGVSFGSNIPLGKIGSAFKGCEEDEAALEFDDDELMQPDLHDELQSSVTFLSCPEVLTQHAKSVELVQENEEGRS